MGAVFFYKFLRNRNISDTGSIFGGFVFIFSSYMIQNFGITMVYQYCLLPVGLYAIDEILTKRKKLWIALFPLIVFQVTVAGYPTTAAYVLSFFGIYFLYSWFKLGPKPNGQLRWPAFFNLTLLFLSGLLLSSLSLLASKDFFSDFDWTYRETYWRWVLEKKHLLEILFPYYMGNQNENAWVRQALYVGILPFLFSVLCLIKIRKSKDEVFFIIFGFITFCFAYDFLGFNYLYQFIPVFNASNPNNLIMILPVFLSIWSAYGFDIFFSVKSFSIKKGAVTVFLVAICFYLWSNFAGVSFPNFINFEDNPKAPLHIFIFLLSLCTFCLMMWAPRHKKHILYLVFVLVYSDLMLMGYKWNRTIPRQSYEPMTQGIEFLHSNLDHGKIFLVGYSFLANTPLYYDIPTVAGRGFYSKRSKEIYRIIDNNAFPIDQPTQYIFQQNIKTKVLNPIFEALGIKYLVADPDAKIEHFARDSIVLLTRHQTILEPGEAVTDTIDVQSTKVSHFSLPELYNKGNNPVTLDMEVRFNGNSYKHTIDVLPGKNMFEKVFEKSIVLDGKIHLSFKNTSEEGRIYLNGIRTFDKKFKRTTLLFWNQLGITDALKDKFKLVYNKDISIWENTNYIGRAWGVTKCQQDSSENIYQKMLAGEINYFADVFIASSDADCDKNADSEPRRIGRIDTKTISETEQIYEFDKQKPFYLVVGDNYDSGWIAESDSQEKLNVLRVNHNMRAVYVPEGTNMVRFYYQPWYLHTGYALMGLGFILLIMVLLFHRSIPRPARKP